ncbi:hypothetical protein GC176_07690 [bacterium]|nr:hypothetical protein [bacterium]
MARRPRDNDDDVSLFPFLSIIACVIGVLTMMISTLALAQMDTPDVVLIEANEKVTGELSVAEQEVARLKKLLDEKIGPGAATVREEVSASEKELTELAAELEKVHKQLEEQQKVKVVIPQLDPAQRESVASMQSQLMDLTEELAVLEKDLSDRKEASESQVTILPGGTGVNFTPHFVECAADSIVLHTMNPPKRIRTASVVADPDFVALLQRVANNVNDSIVFLVRSDALNTYRTVRQICVDREIRNGKLPVVGAGRIDLSHFATQKPATEAKKK